MGLNITITRKEYEAFLGRSMEKRRRSSYFYAVPFDLGGMRRSTSGPAHAVG
jgi:hypothetical protein